ncbi:Aspartic protease pep1 [Cytospora mali]|uniref:Aspartic protease pep1 n=1 Tax=Cytospora mali TaxID=578113 RepID=A0A194V6Z2_CYTMA|nr:Aspartic protease pep1 [Valsa mali var. pyri (nom. inval.)]
MEAIFATQAELKKKLGLRKVMAIPNQNYKAHGTKSYVYLLNRFGFQPTKPGPYRHAAAIHQRGLAHSHVAKGGRLRREHKLVKVTDGQTGEVTAEDQQNDSEYLCEVEIGTPAQKLLLDFDTGSSDLWVFSTELSSSAQKGHTVFDPSKSSTWKTSTGETWKISYGDGSSASGDVGTDTVNIGGVVVKNQSVELAKTAADQFISGTGDGLLGLAYPSINTITKNGQSNPQNTPVANMISQGDIPSDAQLFTSAFYSSRDQKSNSFYTFGYIDQDLVGDNEISYVDIDNSEGFWMFPSTSATVAGKTITQSGNTAIADTGTTLALVSDEVCEALYKAIPGSKYDDEQQGYLFPTSVTADQLPDFTVAVGDKQFTIQKEDLAFTVATEGYWYGGVQSRGDNTFDILGDTFLKSVYAIWDQGNTRLGLVPKIESTQNLEPPSSS